MDLSAFLALQWRSLLSHLSPLSLCDFCQQSHNNSYALCKKCMLLLKPMPYSCRICSLALNNSNYSLCGRCIKKKPHFDKVFCLYNYDEPIKSLLRRFKYYEGFYMQVILVELLANSLPPNYETECLIPVPIHRHRLRQRGFNQSALLTRLLAKKINKPYSFDCCVKIKNTLPQAQLNRKNRQNNLHNSFQVFANNYRHITIVDDLLTTGSTVNELAKTLKNSGIQRVDVVCCARTAT